MREFSRSLLVACFVVAMCCSSLPAAATPNSLCTCTGDEVLTYNAAFDCDDNYRVCYHDLRMIEYIFYGLIDETPLEFENCDFNDDNVVNLRDVETWLYVFKPCPGDFNIDRKVDRDDESLLLTALGMYATDYRKRCWTWGNMQAYIVSEFASMSNNWFMTNLAYPPDGWMSISETIYAGMEDLRIFYAVSLTDVPGSPYYIPDTASDRYVDISDCHVHCDWTPEDTEAHYRGLDPDDHPSSHGTHNGSLLHYIQMDADSDGTPNCFDTGYDDEAIQGFDYMWKAAACDITTLPNGIEPHCGPYTTSNDAFRTTGGTPSIVSFPEKVVLMSLVYDLGMWDGDFDGIPEQDESVNEDEYEDNDVLDYEGTFWNTTWSEGDCNCDLELTTWDISAMYGAASGWGY